MIINRNALRSLIDQGWSSASSTEVTPELLEQVTHEMAHVIVADPKGDLTIPWTPEQVHALVEGCPNPDFDEMKVAAVTATVMQSLLGGDYTEDCFISGQGNIHPDYVDRARTVFDRHLATKKCQVQARKVRLALEKLDVVRFNPGGPT